MQTQPPGSCHSECCFRVLKFDSADSVVPSTKRSSLLQYEVHRHSLAANSMLETDHVNCVQIGTTHAAIGLCCRAKSPSLHTLWEVSCVMRSYATSPTSSTTLSSICTAHKHSWTAPRHLSPPTRLSSPQPQSNSNLSSSNSNIDKHP